MKKAKDDIRLFRLIGIIAAASAIVTMALVVFFILKAYYVAMGIVLVMSVACFYATPFMFFAAYDAKLAVKIIPIAEEAMSASLEVQLENIAAAMGWKSLATEKFLKKCEKRRYITKE